MDIFEADLAAVGIKTDSCISLLMPESYVGLPFMDVDKAEAERRKKTEAVCPVCDISFVKGCTPQWKHNGKCLSCFACYHHCPTRAIEYGGRTKGKGQYYYEKNEKTIISKA